MQHIDFEVRKEKIKKVCPNMRKSRHKRDSRSLGQVFLALVLPALADDGRGGGH